MIYAILKLTMLKQSNKKDKATLLLRHDTARAYRAIRRVIARGKWIKSDNQNNNNIFLTALGTLLKS